MIIDLNEFTKAFISGMQSEIKGKLTPFDKEACFCMFDEALFNGLDPYRAGRAAIITLNELIGNKPSNN